MLSWQGIETEVAMHSDAMAGGGGKRLRTRVRGVVTRRGGGGVTQETEWVFIRRGFPVGTEAQAAYQNHTKKATAPTQDEIFAFFPLTSRGAPAIGEGGGRVHAVLPTKLTSPVACHLQSSWLLSVDRQDVQGLDSNAWNGELAQQLPALCAGILRWVAAFYSEHPAKNTAANLVQAYSLLPLAAGMERSPP